MGRSLGGSSDSDPQLVPHYYLHWCGMLGAGCQERASIYDIGNVSVKDLTIVGTTVHVKLNLLHSCSCQLLTG